MCIRDRPKATYIYWQRRFDRENPDKELEERILEIRKFHKDYGYRRMLGELRNQNIVAVSYTHLTARCLLHDVC